MHHLEQKIIFLNSYLPRAGHNFSSQAIKVFSDHEVLAYPHSETRLSRILESFNKLSTELIYHENDKDFMDRLFIRDLRNRILKESDQSFIMIKDTSLVGIQELVKIFPSDIHLVQIRDPKDVFNSLIRGMDLSEPNVKNYIKKTGIKTGLYPWYYSRKLSNQILKELPDLKQHQVIRYEDLVRKDDLLLQKLKLLFTSEKTLEQIKKEIDKIKVINSSFFEEVKANKIWDIKPKTEDFDPVNRKGNSWFVRKGIEIGSRKLRKKLNYV